MSRKTTISHSSSVVIVYNAYDPSQIFGEQKDRGHPDPSAWDAFSFMGGNWDGKEAVGDGSPRGTLVRELHEEFGIPNPDGHPEEAKHLEVVVAWIIENLVPFAAFLNVPPVDGTASHKEPALVNVYTCGLDTEPWTMLAALQTKFGDLNTEYSSTVITSLEAMVNGKMKAAFGNDRRLQSFWLGLGYDDAKRIPLTEDYVNLFVGPVSSSYKDLLTQYKVLNKPI